MKILTSNDVDGTHEITLKYEIESKYPIIKKEIHHLTACKWGF